MSWVTVLGSIDIEDLIMKMKMKIQTHGTLRRGFLGIEDKLLREETSQLG